MRITVVTIGSRGDVQPYIALCLGLQSAGHTVRLATHALYETEIRGRGLDFAPLEGNPQDVMQGRHGERWEKTSRNPFVFTRQFAAIATPMIEGLVSDCYRACADAHAVVFSAFGWFAAADVIDKLRVPGFPAYLQPATPTSEFAYVSFPQIKLGRWYNRLSYAVSYATVWRAFKAPMNAAREKVLGLSPRNENPFTAALKLRRPLALGYSPVVLPPPRDWGDWVHVTGYWFLDAPRDWQPPQALVDFLGTGEPPVYISFGSMGERKPEEITALVLDALSIAGCRAVLGSGWGDLGQGNLPDHVFVVGYVPHDWLLPRVAAVVHHGGSGTTAAALRAGVPSVAVPFFADQPFWAERVYALGAGVKPIPRQKLNSKNLGEAIRRAVTDADIRACAAGLGDLIRAENGVARAVEVIEAALA